jgi:transcription elongation factor Elf1
MYLYIDNTELLCILFLDGTSSFSCCPCFGFISSDRTRNTGRITCTVCMECFQTSINNLSEAVDVYNDWIDACEQAN